MEIAKLDHIDKQSLSIFLIDLMHTQEQMKKAYEELELQEQNQSNSTDSTD
jgi:hypothetical protein